MTRRAPAVDACPCGTGRSYGDCCGRWHAGPQRGFAPDAQALMRSRYSAYVRSLHGYLLDTWHPSTRPASLDGDPPAVKWLGLEVREHTQQDPDHATVEFVARSRTAAGAQRMHEISRFVREGGRWYYVDGRFPTR